MDTLMHSSYQTPRGGAGDLAEGLVWLVLILVGVAAVGCGKLVHNHVRGISVEGERLATMVSGALIGAFALVAVVDVL